MGIDNRVIKTKSTGKQRGYTVVQLLFTVAIMAIVSAVALMGVTTARASIRLSNSTRQFAAYVERARSDAVRRHGTATMQMLNTTTYAITMDFASSGAVTTQNYSLENGVTFITTLKTVTFDWRGRIPSELSVGFSNGRYTSNVDITGSGDVTIDAEIFHDASIPTVTVSPAPVGLIPDPNPTPESSPSASPSPSPSPSPNASPTPTSTPTPSPSASPTPTSTPTPTPSPTPTNCDHNDNSANCRPTPSPTPTPTPTATPLACSITTSADELSIISNGDGTVSVQLGNFTGSQIITTSGSSGQIQVSPSSATVTDGGSVTFTVTVKKTNGSVTFNSSCGSKTVTITIL